MVDEEKHLGVERFKSWQSSGETLLGCGKLFDFAAVTIITLRWYARPRVAPGCPIVRMKVFCSLLVLTTA
jgi:hypothetical protein